MNLSVVILTKNEESNIFDCLESLPEALEILVVDDESNDRTGEVIRSFSRDVKIIEHRLDSNFSEQRNFALSKARGEWVLFVDADERVSPDLKTEILEILNQDSNYNGFYLKRRDVMWGRELKYGETGNIRLLRLAKKNKGSWKGMVHEVWNIEGEIGLLSNPLMHYPHPTVGEFLKEVDMYSTLRAKELHSHRKKVNLVEILAYPEAKFSLNYFFKLGFLDGTQGFLLAAMMSLHSFLVRAKLWLLIKGLKKY